MVTGDNKVTAMAIARECGIINDETELTSDSVLEGKEFFDRMEGLWCKTCKKGIPKDCKCSKKD